MKVKNKDKVSVKDVGFIKLGKNEKALIITEKADPEMLAKSIKESFGIEFADTLATCIDEAPFYKT